MPPAVRTAHTKRRPRIVSRTEFWRGLLTATYATARGKAPAFTYTLICPKSGGTLGRLDAGPAPIAARLHKQAVRDLGAWEFEINLDTARQRIIASLDWLMSVFWRRIADGEGISAPDSTVLHMWTEYRAAPFKPMTSTEADALFSGEQGEKLAKMLEEITADLAAESAMPHSK